MNTEDKIESIKKVLKAWANGGNSETALAAIMGILDYDPDEKDEDDDSD